ncbi:peptidoglycan DD-metalloendopeptidase family protein [Thalassotalea sp. 1_MG-2023]|uniref:murein hydrolase activator EnvC family protein n=1 Tax=Thalassotalea sp. 1_MG-2023 TaxID=3062680 RepID=UPI0026E3D03A|nr:peptidoglycan DD-metalloendopeptidase family protein [Thalassotalea sp. 1_MG-2023]MDO6425597.1 peptidoglycan DD-metalloendopeptidase family protein [Thalassotalea sp. 1_MG-2023]
MTTHSLLQVWRDKKRVLTRFLSVVVLLFSPVLYAQETATDEQLDQVKKAIKKEKSTIKEVDQERERLLKQLQSDELAISQQTKSLRNTDKKLDNTQQTLHRLTKEKQQLTNKKQQQEALLAKQLRAAYSTGHHDYLKLILNQENPGKVQRTVSYYQYLNTARIKEIEAFQSTITQLNEVEQQQLLQQQQLAQLKKKQQEDKQALEAGKQRREKTVNALNNQLMSAKQQLEKLEAEEESLVAALARIARLSKQDFSLSGLSSLRGKLNWPVNGRINRSFGSRKQGYLKWKGVLLAAPSGKTISTIHHGVVLFSDWLKGYGLVTVIDHGDGYMSLYGHNQALLKSVGDRVETGEPIALVGQSGGQNQSALYFEIRHNGKAVNPKLWCR